MSFIFKGFMYLVFSLSAILIACNSRSGRQKATASIQFQLNADSSEIVLKGLDHAISEAIKNDSLGQEQLKSMFEVYKQASDQDLVGFEKPLPGKYKVEADQITFTPDSAFTNGSIYRAEFRMPEFYDQKDVLNNGKLPGKVSVKEKEFQF